MFDTRKFGSYMSRLRKNADMTQSELAEKLNITRQAVSKYETGDSFPDISILIQVAEVLQTSLDEMILVGNPTKGEAKIIKNIVDGNRENSVEIDDIVNLAPLIKPSVLGAFAKRLNADGVDISHLVSLLQFLNDSDLAELFHSIEYSTLNVVFLEKIVPFLDTDSKESIVSKILEGECDWHLLGILIPYIENMTEQLEAAFLDGALPKESRDMINEYWLNKTRV